jgi:D-serine deaminase-like pyridoxal phosphate-dependent protein
VRTPFVPPQTPALVVDRSALEANLSAMQTLCDKAGVRLRPHGKMHKCSALGRRQVERGAVGLCAQTVGEAEAFVAGGIRDVLVSSPPQQWAASRLAALASRARVRAVADHPEQVRWLAAATEDAGAALDVLIDIDPGNHRCGVPPAQAVDLAGRVARIPRLRFGGIQMYAGALQHIANRDQRARAYADVIAAARAVVDELRAAGHAVDVVSGGGTGSHAFDLQSGVFTELQAGSYAFMDAEYASCDPSGSDVWPFTQALRIASRVVSANHRMHVTIDAGLKAISTDGPLARVIGGAPAGSTWRPMGDEHGFVVLPEGSSDVPALGDVVWLQPGHVDPTVNLYDVLWVVAEDGTAEPWPIDARRVSPRP